MHLEPSWKKEIFKKLSTEKREALNSFLQSSRIGKKKVFPPIQEVFNAFWVTPLDKVKVVIVGQDPYHTEGMAHGLAFSVKKGLSFPPSLKNIFKELSEDLMQPPPSHGCLESWAAQGVFLYNTRLTVEEGAPLSHAGLGWEEFSEAVFDVLAEKKDPLVLMFWGKAALQYAKKFENKDKPNFLVLKAAHPSPLSAKGFFGCRHFSKANAFLEKWGKTPISWRIEEL